MPRDDVYVKAQYDERYGGDHSIILEAYLDSEGEHMIAAERMVKSSSDSTYDEHRHNFMQQIYNNIATNRANHNQRNWTYPEMLTNFLSQFKS